MSKVSSQDFNSKYGSWFIKTWSVSNAIQQGIRGQDFSYKSTTGCKNRVKVDGENEDI